MALAAAPDEKPAVVEIQVAAANLVFFDTEALAPAVDRRAGLLQDDFRLIERRGFRLPWQERGERDVGGQFRDGGGPARNG